MAEEASEFILFEGIEGPSEYTDFKKAFEVVYSITKISAQGEGTVPKCDPFKFHIKGGTTDLSTFQEATRGNMKSKLKKATFTRCVFINGKRMPSMIATMEKFSLSNVEGDHQPGNGEQLIAFMMDFKVISWKTTDYKSDGTVRKAVGPKKWDFEKGEFTG